jgi:hypothetical protein
VLLASADYLNAGGTFPDGTVSVPSITFTEDTDTGFFRVSSGQIGIVANGTKVAQFPASTGSSGQLLSTNGAGVLSYVDPPASATGGGSDKAIYENTIGTSFGSTCNAMSAGPITINSGITLTIPAGSTYTVV